MGKIIPTVYLDIQKQQDNPLVEKIMYHKGAIAPRDGTGWPASLPYIRKIYVFVAIGIQSLIRLHKRVPMVKIWGSSKNDQNRIM